MDTTYHPEVDEIIEALRPLANQCRVEAAYWIATPGGGQYESMDGSDWCRECGMAKVRHLRKHDRKHANEYILDGGWVSEHDTPPMCVHCGVKLEASLLAYGGVYELEHFRDNPPIPGNVDHAYEVSEMLSAFQCTRPDHDDAAREAIEIGRFLVAAMKAEPA